MVVGKNKKLGKKGKGKKIVDPFLHKDWYDVKAPTLFSNRNVGKTLVNRSQGKSNIFVKHVFSSQCSSEKTNFSCVELATDDLKGRVYEVNLADLQNNETFSYRKIKLICEEVYGKNCLLNFHGMNLTTDKLRMLVRRWQTLIEAHVDVKTTDNYYLRMFCIGFTTKVEGQQKKTCYAQTNQIRQIRKIMMEKMATEASSSDFKELCNRLINGNMGNDIIKKSSGVFPLKDVYIRKVKVLKRPKFDQARLLEMHGEAKSQVLSDGKVIRTGEFVEPIPSDSI